MDAMTNFGKHQTIDRYKTHQFVHSLFSHSLTALTCTLLCSYPYWVPSLRSSLKQLLFLSLPKMLSSFFCPKWLFIVVNVIVVYLVGESKLLGSPTYSCSSSAEIYEEYVERSKSFRRSSVSSRPQTTEQSKLELNLVENRPVFDDEKEEGMLSAEDKHQVPEEEQEEEEKEKDREVEEDCEEQEEKVGEEEIGLPADELNKRVEEFIARINKQRWLEEKLLVSCMA